MCNFLLQLDIYDHLLALLRNIVPQRSTMCAPLALTPVLLEDWIARVLDIFQFHNPSSTAWTHLGHHGFATSIRKGRLHTAARWKSHGALRLFGSAPKDPKDHGAEWPGRGMSAPTAALQDSNEKVGKVL